MWTYILIAILLIIIMYGASNNILKFPKGGHESGLLLFLPSIIAIVIIIFGTTLSQPKDVKLVNQMADKIRCYESWTDKKNVIHPRKYTLVHKDGIEFPISRSTYDYFLSLWNNKTKITVDGKDVIESKWDNDPKTSLVVCNPKIYSNHMINIYELYDIENITISRAIGDNLFIRPSVGIVNSSNIIEPRQNLILGYNTPDSIQRKANHVASLDEMFRPVLLIWTGEENNKISQQRSLWHSGKENEAVFCIGLDEDDKIIWSGSFSWDNSKKLETFILREVLKPGMTLDLNKYVNYLESGYKNGYWKPINTSNYDFVKISYDQIRVITIMITIILLNIIVAIRIYRKNNNYKLKQIEK